MTGTTTDVQPPVTDQVDEPENTGDAPGADTQQPNGAKPGTITLTEAELQQRIEADLKVRLERERKKSEAAADKARKEAEDAALETQQEWQKLAEQRQTRITELEPLQAQMETAEATIERYKGALTSMLEAQRKDLPAHILSLLDKQDPVDQLEYLAANADELRPQGRQGIPATPKANGTTKLTDDERRKQAARTW